MKPVIMAATHCPAMRCARLAVPELIFELELVEKAVVHESMTKSQHMLAESVAALMLAGLCFSV